jgi:hypothetical protein
MGDRLGSPSQVRMSEDKVRRKNMCWYVRDILEVLESCKASVGRYRNKHESHR